MHVLRLLSLQVGVAMGDLLENENFRRRSGRHLHSICLEDKCAMPSLDMNNACAAKCIPRMHCL